MRLRPQRPTTITHPTRGRYMKTGDISRARSHFYHGNVPILLFSERFHYFNRFRIRGTA